MRAIYLALATWAFAESVRLLITVEYQITRGDLGLATPFLFGTPRSKGYYYVFLGLAVAAVLAAWQLVHSRIGVYMRAIRDDEEAAAVMGVDTFKWKRFVFAISAVFAAVAGGFQGHYVGLLSPTPMKFNEMAMIVIMVIVGGLRTFPGPILGAVFIELLFEWLRAWGEVRMVLFALLVIVVARGYPAGLAGVVQDVARRVVGACRASPRSSLRGDWAIEAADRAEAVRSEQTAPGRATLHCYWSRGRRGGSARQGFHRIASPYATRFDGYIEDAGGVEDQQKKWGLRNDRPRDVSR